VWGLQWLPVFLHLEHFINKLLILSLQSCHFELMSISNVVLPGVLQYLTVLKDGWSWGLFALVRMAIGHIGHLIRISLHLLGHLILKGWNILVRHFIVLARRTL
jgi:hypothetical protein